MNNNRDPLDRLPAAGGIGPPGQLPPVPEPVEFNFPLISQRTREDLEDFGANMLHDYRDFKEELLTWLANYGKHPQKGEGLADATLKSTHYQLETTFRWLWTVEDECTTDLTPEKADKLIRLLDRANGLIDSSDLHCAKSIKRYFKYHNYVHGTDWDWSAKPELSQANGDERDYLRRETFQPLYQAALKYNSVKSYYNTKMTPNERDQIKTYLSKRMGVPKEEVGPDTFREANSWKIPSIIAVTLDTGLRPIEVGRAKAHWVNLEHNELNIPKDESTKNEEHWNCTLKGRTAKVLERWLDERETYEMYDDRDELWLTKQECRYSSGSCNHLLRRLIEEGDVPIPDDRDISWYSIRHGVATYWANHVGPHHAMEQLRHKSVNTTMKYLHSDPETRSTAVEQIW